MRAIIIAYSGMILFLTMNVISFASETGNLTINLFLASVDDDYCLANHQELLDYLSTASSSTPYVDKIELRTYTEDFEIGKQKYALRFYSKGWGETRYNNLLARSIRNAYDIEHEVYFNKALTKRYFLVIDYLESMDVLRLMRELEMVYKDRLGVLRKQVGTISFDVAEYIETENSFTELQLDLVKIENKLTGIKHRIHLLISSDAKITFDRQQLIGVEDIELSIEKIDFESTPENIYISDRKNKIEIAKMKYNIEKSQDRDYLSYIQVEYDHDNRLKPEKAYSLDIGFKLPFVNSDREDINRREVNYLEQKLKYEDEVRDHSERIQSKIRSLHRYIDQYRIISERKVNEDARSPLETYMKMEGINPLSLLEIRENIINNDLQQNQIYFSILNDYIDLMDLTGKLSEKPLRNHISEGLEALDER